MRMKSYAQQERHVEIRKKMELLGIQDVTTNRQHKNGTVVWRLPIKYSKDKFIEVASFKTGYVRNQNSGYSNYQINKRCESEPEYYQLANGNYRKYTTRTCKLIPNEIDRLEYLIAYCLKNYYIKHANFVADGEYISKSNHEWELERQKEKFCDELADFRNEVQDCGHYDRIKELESDVFTQKQRGDGYKAGCSHKNQEINNLQNKLATIQKDLLWINNKWNG